MASLAFLDLMRKSKGSQRCLIGSGNHGHHHHHDFENDYVDDYDASSMMMMMRATHSMWPFQALASSAIEELKGHL